MPLSHDFEETIQERAQRDPDSRQALPREGVECIIKGEIEPGKAVLCEFIRSAA